MKDTIILLIIGNVSGTFRGFSLYSREYRFPPAIIDTGIAIDWNNNSKTDEGVELDLNCDEKFEDLTTRGNWNNILFLKVSGNNLITNNTGGININEASRLPPVQEELTGQDVTGHWLSLLQSVNESIALFGALVVPMDGFANTQTNNQQNNNSPFGLNFNNIQRDSGFTIGGNCLTCNGNLGSNNP